MRAWRVVLSGKSHLLLTVALRSDPATSRLTPAERDIARALVTGATNALMSAARNTSVNTVANQVRAVFEKLSVGSRTELIARYGDVDFGTGR